MNARRRFMFRPGLAVATGLALCVLLALGGWQLRRLDWKRDLIAQAEAMRVAAPTAFADLARRAADGERIDYRPVFAEGVFDHGREARVFGTYDGRPGVFVFTPLTTEGGDVWINRGFAPQALADPATRADARIEGRVRVEGLLRTPERPRGLAGLLAPPPDEPAGLYYQRDPAIFAGAAPGPGLYIDSSGRENAAAWPKGGVTRLEFPNRHLEYALTWFGLALTLVGVFAAMSFVRREDPQPSERSSAGSGSASSSP